jgi:hypothetical protein
MSTSSHRGTENNYRPNYNARQSYDRSPREQRHVRNIKFNNRGNNNTHRYYNGGQYNAPRYGTVGQDRRVVSRAVTADGHPRDGLLNANAQEYLRNHSTGQPSSSQSVGSRSEN